MRFPSRRNDSSLIDTIPIKEESNYMRFSNKLPAHSPQAHFFVIYRVAIALKNCLIFRRKATCYNVSLEAPDAIWYIMQLSSDKQQETHKFCIFVFHNLKKKLENMSRACLSDNAFFDVKCLYHTNPREHSILK